MFWDLHVVKLVETVKSANQLDGLRWNVCKVHEYVREWKIECVCVCVMSGGIYLHVYFKKWEAVKLKLLRCFEVKLVETIKSRCESYRKKEIQAAATLYFIFFIEITHYILRSIIQISF